MTHPIVIVDTNVVVAGLITAQDASPVARILDGMLTAAFPYVVSEALLAEYRTVLARPGLRKLHGLTIAEVETLLTDVALHAIDVGIRAVCRRRVSVQRPPFSI